MTTIEVTAENIEQLLETNPEAVNMDDPRVAALITKLSGESDGEPSGDESGDDAPGTDDAAAKAAAEEAARKAVEDAARAQADAAKPVIKSKDGKHEIPFEVLETERAEREAATAAAKQLAAVVQALEGEVERLKSGGKDGGEDGGGKVHPLRAALDAARAEVEKTSQEYPDLAPQSKAILDSMVTMAEQMFGQLDAATKEIDELRRVAVGTVQERRESAKKDAEQALAQVPALVVWRTKNPDLFKLAAKFDADLRGDPEWKGKTNLDRFQKAVEMVVAVRGAKALEGVTVTPQKDTTPGAKAPDAKAAIAAALGITSLSDLPGGSAVSQVPGSLEGMSESQLVEKLAGMDEASLFGFIAGAVD